MGVHLKNPPLTGQAKHNAILGIELAIERGEFDDEEPEAYVMDPAECPEPGRDGGGPVSAPASGLAVPAGVASGLGEALEYLRSLSQDRSVQLTRCAVHALAVRERVALMELCIVAS